MKKHRLLWRIYFYFLTATLVTLGITTWHAVSSLQKFMDKQTIQNLTTRAQLVSQLVEKYGLNNINGIFCQKMAKSTDSRVSIILPNGQVIADSDQPASNMDNHATRPEVKKALSGKIGESTRFSQTLKKQLKYIAIPLCDNNTTIAVIRLAQPLKRIHWTQHIISRQIILGTITAAIFFAIIALFLSRQITSPLENMRAIADRLAHGDLKSRATISSADELGALAASLNQMAEQLETRIQTIKLHRVEQNAMLSCMTEGVLAIDQDTRILYINNAASKLLGISPADARLKTARSIIHDIELQNFVVNSINITNQNTTDKTTITDINSRRIRLQRTILTDPTGWNIGALIVMDDVTEIKRLETMRSDFVANVSHELKTPITALKGCVETLMAPDAPDQQETASFLSMMDRHVNRLEAIVSDLLTLSHIEFEMNNKHIQLQRESIANMLHHAANTFTKRLKNKNIAIATDCPPDLKAHIHQQLLEQAITNLIDNAIKYSPANTSISLSAKKDKSNIIIKVSDQGCGVPKKHQPRIFERFYRVDKARSRAAGGTGLGLAITKHIILAHNGQISVSSSGSLGTTFTISIPATPDHPQP